MAQRQQKRLKSLASIPRGLYVAVLVALLALAVSHRAAAVEYDTTLIGLSAEGDVVFDPDVALSRLSVVFTYGPEATHPVRFRGGLGYFPSYPFALSAGVEIPLYEKLNRSHAKFFGLYLTGDLALEIENGAGFGANAGAHLLIPAFAMGGITVGGGVTETLEPFARIGLVTGVYPLVVSRQE